MNEAVKQAITHARDGHSAQPAKLRDASRFARLLAERDRSAPLFHAWRP